MIRRLGHAFAAFFRATTPDPFVLAIGLTVVVFALAFVVEGASPIEIVRAWQGDAGFFSLLAFTMQMLLILVTGHALASAPPVARLLARIAAVPTTAPRAVWLVSTVAIATALVNWGLGLVVGAILARDVGRSASARGVPVHYPLVAAAGYTGLLAWHGGLSGSAPLMMTTQANVAKFLGDELAARVGTLPFTETVLGLDNLLVTGGLLLLVPLAMAAMSPTERAEIETMREVCGDDALAPSTTGATPPPETFVERIERSRITMALAALPLAFATFLFYAEHGIETLDPNALNLTFLTLGLVLHGTPARYASAVSDAVAGTSGIVLQFPFYAGIMGVVRTTGLAATLATAVSSVASEKTFGVLTMLSAAIVNLFVPSGGGQWAVQGPIAVEAAEALGVPAAEAVMAVAYGDQLTNMLQPFWALPLLAITFVKARDVIGYTAVAMLVAGAYIATLLVVLA